MKTLYRQKRLTHRTIGENLRRKEMTFFRQRFSTRRCSDIFNSLTSPWHPEVVGLYVNACHFSTTARRVTLPTWGPSHPCRQALTERMEQVYVPPPPSPHPHLFLFSLLRTLTTMLTG